MSEQAPEPRPAPGGPPKKDNVFTRKIGPLPMWVWLAIAAALILGYVLFFGKKKKGSTTGGAGSRGRRGFGGFLRPPGVPHVRHHRRGDHDSDDQGDAALAGTQDQMTAARSPGVNVPGPPPDEDVPVGVDRRHKRGEPVQGQLVQFKTAEQGQTPSLADVANHYGTAPEAVVQEAEGRGYPSSVAWKRYVARHDWASPLPPATDFSILAHPG